LRLVEQKQLTTPERDDLRGFRVKEELSHDVHPNPFLSLPPNSYQPNQQGLTNGSKGARRQACIPLTHLPGSWAIRF